MPSCLRPFLPRLPDRAAGRCLNAAWMLAALLLAAWSPARASQGMASLIEAAAQAHAAGLPGEVRITVGKQAAALPACEAPETFIPAGSKPWGELLVGVRCQAGSAWTRFVPVQLSVAVRHAVALGSLPAGHKLSPADVSWASGDLARLPRDVVLDETLLAGAVTLHPLAAGAPLRRDLIKVPPVILQGQWVKVTTVGAGFLLSAEGKAQNNAAPGSPVQLRMANGQVITAVARPDGSAEKAP